MTPENDDDVSLWEQLGIAPDVVEDAGPDDDSWNRMIQVAVDPDTPEADSSLVPTMSDEIQEYPDDLSTEAESS
ncbi:MAG: hypothetical protein ICV72_04920 [Aldersonia sp.]|nr:hypothetical protein [Aldersonia sp.]